MEISANTTIIATVLWVRRCCLLVCDHSSNQEILVHSSQACHFFPGDCVHIQFSGAMTRSIPPQITADCITCHNPC